MTLYEREATCGGHTLTDTTSGYPVDLGFQVWVCGPACPWPSATRYSPAAASGIPVLGGLPACSLASHTSALQQL